MRSAVPRVRPYSRSEIHRKAESLVATVAPETLKAEMAFPIAEFCEFQMENAIGVSFRVEELSAGGEGRIENQTLILDVSTYEALERGESRARFTLAHELGHAVLHAKELTAINSGRRGRVQLYRRGSLPAYLDPEWQANEYAAALLMPSAAISHLARLHGPGRLPTMMSIRLGVSLSAAETRINVIQKGARGLN